MFGAASWMLSTFHSAKDLEVFKVWDSLEFEEEEENRVTQGIEMQAAVDNLGTASLM